MVAFHVPTELTPTVVYDDILPAPVCGVKPVGLPWGRPMIDDSWEKLLNLKTRLLLSSDRAATLADLADEEGVIEVYADDVEQGMFVVAAARMADLLGIVCFRLDVEEGKPQMIFSFGSTHEEAKVRMRRHYEAIRRDVEASPQGTV